MCRLDSEELDWASHQLQIVLVTDFNVQFPPKQSPNLVLLSLSHPGTVPGGATTHSLTLIIFLQHDPWVKQEKQLLKPKQQPLCYPTQSQNQTSFM